MLSWADVIELGREGQNTDAGLLQSREHSPELVVGTDENLAFS